MEIKQLELPFGSDPIEVAKSVTAAERIEVAEFGGICDSCGGTIGRGERFTRVEVRSAVLDKILVVVVTCQRCVKG